MRELRALAKGTDRRAIAAAFLTSLGQPPGPWRAPLAGLAAALAVPTHRYRAFSASSPDCGECGLLPDNELEPVDPRGQILPGDLASAVVALRFAREADERPRLDRDGARRLSRVLALVGELPATARESKLVDAIRKEKLVTGNRYDVRAVIETLGACGILETPEHPGFTTRWTTFGARQDRPSSRTECDPPIAFWTAAHGVNARNVGQWFGALGVKVAAASRPRPAPVAKASRAADARARRAARATELAVGEVIAVPDGTTWHAAIVVQHHRDKGGTYPVLEVIDWQGAAAPTLAQLRGLPARGARGQRYRAMMIGLWKRDDPQGRWRALDGTLPLPSNSHLATPVGLYHLARVEKDGRGLRAFVAATRR